MSKWSKLLIVSFLLVIVALTFIVKTNNVLEIDDFVYTELISLKSETLTNITKVITNFGGVLFITIMTIILIFIFRKNIYSKLIPVNIINVVIINLILKNFIQRPRPSFYHLVEESGFSFPSGHAMASMGFYGFLIFMVSQSNLEKKYKILLIGLLSFLIIAIGISRIYLGVHYFTDIVAGFIIGIVYLLLFTNYIKKYLKNE